MKELAALLGAVFTNTKKAPTTKELRATINTFLSESSPDEAPRTGIHVSDLISPCIRRIAWKIARPEMKNPPPDAASRRIFDQGNAIHRWWQNHIYGPAHMLFGDWMCSGCGEIQSGTLLPNMRCVSGRCPGRWVYRESTRTFRVRGVTVTGSPDGRIMWDNALHILEMKSMRTDEWKELRLPKQMNVLQASFYAALFSAPRVMISYIDKDTWDTKDFSLPPMSQALSWAESIIETAQSVVNNPLKGAPACKNKAVVRARRCACLGLCFP
jgi:hypothetical protein